MKYELQALIIIFQCEIWLFYTKGRDHIVCLLDHKTASPHIAYIYHILKNLIFKYFHLLFSK